MVFCRKITTADKGNSHEKRTVQSKGSYEYFFILIQAASVRTFNLPERQSGAGA
jgi:hypothetical protein